MAVPDRPWRQTMKAWLASPEVQGKRIHFVLYPYKSELMNGRGGYTFSSMRNLLAEIGITHSLDVSKSPRWDQTLFRDGIHPTAEGNEVLSQLLAEELTKTAH
jgi:lysophospholipase L1-like esterase